MMQWQRGLAVQRRTAGCSGSYQRLVPRGISHASGTGRQTRKQTTQVRKTLNNTTSSAPSSTQTARPPSKQEFLAASCAGLDDGWRPHCFTSPLLGAFLLR